MPLCSRSLGISLMCFLHRCPPPRSPHFPYTTLFRSELFRIAGMARQIRHEKGTVLLQEGTVPDTDAKRGRRRSVAASSAAGRAEEHTSELQSPCNIVCRRLLEKNEETRRQTTPRATT